MIDFKSIKESLNLIDTARHYGIHITGNNMINCLFHNDKNPSMKLYHDHFYCFGCGEHGDVIAFTAKLFGLSQYEAAKKLSQDFGVHVSGKQSIRTQIKYLSRQEQENHVLSNLANYCRFLQKCRIDYAPKTANDELHPLFIESLKELDKFEYLFDCFLNATSEERQLFITERKDFLYDLNRKLHPVSTHRSPEEIA